MKRVFASAQQLPRYKTLFSRSWTDGRYWRQRKWNHVRESICRGQRWKEIQSHLADKSVLVGDRRKYGPCFRELVLATVILKSSVQSDYLSVKSSVSSTAGAPCLKTLCNTVSDRSKKANAWPFVEGHQRRENVIEALILCRKGWFLSSLLPNPWAHKSRDLARLARPPWP